LRRSFFLQGKIENQPSRDTFMTRSIALACFIAAISSVAIAQDNESSGVATSLDAAKQLSAATGRPIFAIAGRST
jgi:hypothetical protein